jgi:hypothetical protein
LKKEILVSTLWILFTTFTQAGSVSISSPTIDLGESTTLKAIGYNSGDSFIWRGGMKYREIFADEEVFHFRPNIAGTHTIELIVNGKSEDNVTINVNPTPPQTNIEAGDNQTICLGEVARLKATAPANTKLEWKIENDKYADGPVFNFYPHQVGIYDIDLFGNNEEDSLVVTVNNCSCGKPIANAGADQSVAKDTTVQLDGSASSDPDNDTLTYTWSFIDKPTGSVATLSDSSLVNPTFDTDIKGLYTLQLVVNDGQTNSTPDSVKITCKDNSTPSPVPVCIDPTTLTPQFD